MLCVETLEKRHLSSLLLCMVSGPMQGPQLNVLAVIAQYVMCPICVMYVEQSLFLTEAEMGHRIVAKKYLIGSIYQNVIG